MRRFLPATLRQRLLFPVLAGVLLAMMAISTGLEQELRHWLGPVGAATRETSVAALPWALVLGVVTGLLLWRLLGHVVFDPVDALLRTVRGLECGNLSARTGLAPHRRGELADLGRAIDDLGVRLEMHARHQHVVDEALRQSEARKAVIVAASRDGIVTFDAEGRVLEFNPAAERMFGRSAFDVLGEPIDGLLRSVDWDAGATAAALAGRTLETRAHRADGSEFPCELCVVSAATISGTPLYTAYVRDLTARRRYEQALRELSFLDDLTRLNNRRGFLRFAEQQLRLADRQGLAATLVYADLDGLKAINDARGHDAGDRAIAGVADALRETFRQSDVLGRIGGDEFVVLATESGGEPPAHRVRRLHAAVAAHSHRLRLPLTLSVGVVRRVAGSRTGVTALLAKADARMYAAKRTRVAGSAEGSAA